MLRQREVGTGMTIDKQGWIDWAIKRPGPGSKVYAEKNQSLGLVLHSVEGWLAGAFGELDNPNRQASWMFTNALDGKFYQHYPVTASCWASGNKPANTTYWSVESEGIAGTPLNDVQVLNMLLLCEEFETYTNKKATRSQPARTLFEHREVAVAYFPNAGPTACPSGRYEPFYAALSKPQEKTVVSQEEFDLMKARMTTMESALTGADKDTVAAMNAHMKKGLRPILDRINTLETTGPASSGNAVTGTFVGTITKAKG